MVTLVIRQKSLFGEKHFILHFIRDVNTDIEVGLGLLGWLGGLELLVGRVGFPFERVTVDVMECLSLVLTLEP
jgi:hypothetical protein